MVRRLAARPQAYAQPGGDSALDPSRRPAASRFTAKGYHNGLGQLVLLFPSVSPSAAFTLTLTEIPWPGAGALLPHPI